MSAHDATRTRKSAEERREEIVALAIEQFALGGYRGTSTDAIAREAGISQPYLFRLFKTKRELFLACLDVSDARIMETFQAAARGVAREEVLPAMGRAYVELLAVLAVRETRLYGRRPRRDHWIGAVAGVLFTADLILWHHSIAES